jgi:hypothetical protein
MCSLFFFFLFPSPFFLPFSWSGPFFSFYYRDTSDSFCCWLEVYALFKAPLFGCLDVYISDRSCSALFRHATSCHPTSSLSRMNTCSHNLVPTRRQSHWMVQALARDVPTHITQGHNHDIESYELCSDS